MYIKKLFAVRQSRKMQDNGENDDKLNMLNDSIIICSPTPKPMRRKGSQITKKAMKTPKAKTKFKTYYESPLKHIQKRFELLNIERKVQKKAQRVGQLECAANSLLPIQVFDHQDSVIILSDNESEICEASNNNNKFENEQRTVRRVSNRVDSSCYIISDDERSNKTSDTDGESGVPQTSEQSGSDSHNAEDIMVLWHNGKNVAKQSTDLPDTPDTSKSETPVNTKKRKRDSGTSSENTNTVVKAGQGKKGKKNTEAVKIKKKKGNENPQCSGPKNKKNAQRKNKENSNEIESNGGPAAKKAKTSSRRINEKEENTLSFVPKYNVTLPRFQSSQKQPLTKGKTPKFITYTKIGYQEGCSNILTASEPEETAHKDGDLRQIVIDGSNIAMLYTNGKKFSERGVEILAQHFKKAGHTVKVFIPHYRRSPTNFPVLEKLYTEGVVVFTPSRYIAGKRITPYDDRYILQYATMCGGVVVSADQYRDLYSEKPEWRETIEKRLLIPTFVGDYVMLPEDPLGRGGPKLYDFLRH